MYVFEERGGIVLHPETKQERESLTLLFAAARLERHPEYRADYTAESVTDSASGVLEDGQGSITVPITHAAPC